MRRFLTGPKRPPEPREPAPRITPADSDLSEQSLEPPNDGTLKYNPLGGDREFRVLVLLPGSGEDEIACVLENVFLDDWLTHYEALSYMWGPAEPLFPISVDGGTSCIRKNLLNALKSLRHPTESRLLFIDALCINMKDVPERNRMVANMSQIYQRASKVLVWLGDADEVSDFAFDKVNQRMPWADLTAPLERATASTLTSVFNRPYWRRVWVLQEILSGYNLEVYCGTKHSPWMQFISVMRFMDAKVDMDPGRKFAKWCVGTPGMTLLRLQNGQAPRQHKMADLLDVCLKCDSGCYDVRDKLYGLLSITTEDRKGLKLEPDYSKSQAQLCIDVFLVEFSKDNAHFRVSSLPGMTPQRPLNIALVPSQRSMQTLLEEPLWNRDLRQFFPLASILDEQQSFLLRNSFSKASLRGMSSITWTSAVLSASSPSKILFAQLEIDAMYEHEELRLPPSIAKVKTQVSRWTVRDYHSTEQLRVRYAWSPQIRAFRTESTYRSTDPPYFLTGSMGKCKIFITQNGVMGIATVVIQPLDILCAVEGQKDVYVVIRPRSDSNRIGFRLIGKAVLLKGEESVSGLGISGQGEEERIPNELTRAIDDAIEYTNDVTTGPEGTLYPKYVLFLGHGLICTGLGEELALFRRFEAVMDAATTFFLTR